MLLCVVVATGSLQMLWVAITRQLAERNRRLEANDVECVASAWLVVAVCDWFRVKYSSKNTEHSESRDPIQIAENRLFRRNERWIALLMPNQISSTSLGNATVGLMLLPTTGACTASSRRASICGKAATSCRRNAKTWSDERVVVICRPPSSHEYRHAGAARTIGKRISKKLEANVDGIDVVSPQEVDNWVDEQDWDNFKDLGRAVKATRVVYVELDDFSLYKGATLYQGDANVKLSVYDMDNRGKLTFERNVGPDPLSAQQRHSRC